jgi:hypothetical protein
MEQDIIDDMESLSESIWEELHTCDLSEPGAIISVLSSVLCEFAIQQNISEDEILEGVKECYEYSLINFGPDSTQ